MRRKRLLPLWLTLCLALSLLLPAVPAGANALTDMTKSLNWPTGPSIEAKSAILIDAKNGNILYQKKANKTCYPASITKVMTALIVLEHCSLDEEVTFSYRATHELEPGSTTIARTEGEIMTVNDCLHALLLQSANEVAQGLAEHVAGSIEDFADMMNEKALELGCTKTHFNNPSGLNSKEHYTTCHDMALILQAAAKNPDFLKIEEDTTYTIPPTNKHEEETPIAQKHALVKNGPDHYEGALAGKTGYTTIAGHTLVTYAARGDMELVCVIMRSEGTHYADTRALLDYGFNHFTMKNLSSTTAKAAIRRSWEEERPDASASLSDAQWEGAYFSEDSFLLLPETLDFAYLDNQVTFLADPAGCDANTPFARIQYLNQDQVLGTGTLYLDPSIMEETAAEAETEAILPVPQEPEPTLKDTLKEKAIFIGGKIYGLGIFLRNHMGIRVWIQLLAALALIGILILAIYIFRNGLRRKNKKYYGPHFTSRPRRFGRNKNKYHMKK